MHSLEELLYRLWCSPWYKDACYLMRIALIHEVCDKYDCHQMSQPQQEDWELENRRQQYPTVEECVVPEEHLMEEGDVVRIGVPAAIYDVDEFAEAIMNGWYDSEDQPEWME